MTITIPPLAIGALMEPTTVAPMPTRNVAKCRKCGDVIESKHRHDFVWCKCKAIAVDGGMEYFKRCGEIEDFLEPSEEELR